MKLRKLLRAGWLALLCAAVPALAATDIAGNGLDNVPFTGGETYTLPHTTYDLVGHALLAVPYTAGETYILASPNTAPTNIVLSSTSLAENNAPGATIGTLTAQDPDAGQMHAFALVVGAGDTDNASFTISSNVLSLNLSADFETQSSYFIRLRATDNGAGNLAFEKEFIITITDVTLPQTITFGALGGKTFGDADFTVSATGGASGQPVTFSIFSGPATLSSNTVTITGAGDVTVRASQAGAGDYSVATNVDQTFAVAKATQAITFGALGGKTFGDAPFTVAATGGAGGEPVTFSIVSGPATLTSNTVTITGAGDVTVRAAQAGTTNYFAATDVDQTFTVAKATQAITFGALGGRTFGDADFTVSATGGASGEPVTFSIVSGPATLTSNIVTITGAGDVTVRAAQAGTTNYFAATNVDQTFTVAKAAQAITFNPPATALSNDTVTLSATGGASSNAVTFSVFSGPGSITGDALTFTGTGSVVVRAAQLGNTNYLAATDVDRTIEVSAPPAPEITLEQPVGTNVLSGATNSFGLVNVGTNADLVFTIRNTGDVGLNLTGTPTIVLSGSTNFSVIAQPGSPVAPSNTTSFTVRFTPTSGGAKTGTLSITNNDSDEGVFTIELTGTGNTAPVAVDHCDGAISGTPAIISAVKLLAGATDADGDTLTLTNVSALSTNGGTVVITGTNVTYTPVGGFFGPDAFTYTVSDGLGGSASATVVVNVLDATLPLLNRVQVVVSSNAPLVRFVGLPCHDYTLLRSLVPQGPFTPLLTFTAPASGLIEHLDTTLLTNIVIVRSYTNTNNVTHIYTNPPYSSVFFRMVTQP